MAEFPPRGLLSITHVVWPQDRAIERIHRDAYGPAQFNDSVNGNARFSPLSLPDGRLVPTLYGGGTFDCALMEVPFHDVPYAPGTKTVSRKKLAGLVHSTLRPSRQLVLADLTHTALRKLGVAPEHITASEKIDYPCSRAWAASIHAQDTTLDGLYWMSKQDNREPAVVLFGDRVSAIELVHAGATRSITGRSAFGELLDLADRLGVRIGD